MNRQSRELAERIRWIEGFDVVIDIPLSLANDKSQFTYPYTRAASKKWTIDQWIEKRLPKFQGTITPTYADGSTPKENEPIADIREHFRLQKWYEKPPFGTKISIKCSASDSEVAMQMKQELSEIGISASYESSRFIFWVSHILKWESPPIHMMTHEWTEFITQIERVVSYLDGNLDWHVLSSERTFLDQCPKIYKYLSGNNT